MKGEDALVAKTRILTLTQIKKIYIKILVPIRLVNYTVKMHTPCPSSRQVDHATVLSLSDAMCSPHL